MQTKSASWHSLPSVRPRDRILEFGLPLVEPGFWVECVHHAQDAADADELSRTARDCSGCGGDVLPRSVWIHEALSDSSRAGEYLIAVFHDIFVVNTLRTIRINVVAQPTYPGFLQLYFVDGRCIFWKVAVKLVNADLMTGYVSHVDRMLLGVPGIFCRVLEWKPLLR